LWRRGAAGELGLCLGQGPLSGREIGRRYAHALGFVLASLLRGVGFALQLGEGDLPLLDVRLRVDERLLAGLDRPQRLGRSLLLLLDVRLEAGEGALDLGERRLALRERRFAFGDPVLDALDGRFALLEVPPEGRQRRRLVLRVGRLGLVVLSAEAGPLPSQLPLALLELGLRGRQGLFAVGDRPLPLVQQPLAFSGLVGRGTEGLLALLELATALVEGRNLDLAGIDPARPLAEVTLEAGESLLLAPQPGVRLVCLLDPLVEIGEENLPAFDVGEALLQLGGLGRDGLTLGGDLGAEPLDLFLALPERLAVAFQASSALRLRALSRDELLAPALEVGRELLRLALAGLQLGGKLLELGLRTLELGLPCRELALQRLGFGFPRGELLLSLRDVACRLLELGCLVSTVRDLSLHGREPAPLGTVQPQPAAQAALVLRESPLLPVELLLAPGNRIGALPQRLLEPLQLVVLARLHVLLENLLGHRAATLHALCGSGSRD
jgi:hypothetical protein